jgi:AbrB family looped-hinge helix DNA binding protein
MKAIVSEKGQVTIPKALRDRLGIRPGQTLDFVEERGRLVAVKLGTRDSIDEVAGTLDLGMSTDEFIEQLRGPRDLR